MKVIDLLNKIANGEETPSKIQVYNDIFVFDDTNNIYEHKETRTNLLSIYNGNILNYEVEIIEDKKIDKIKNMNTDGKHKNWEFEKLSKEEITLDIQTLKNKINEIIDYLEENK